VCMFQKEVAERIAAKPGSKTYGVISVLVQAYFSVEYLFDVPPQSFEPPPKVMSGVIRMRPKVVSGEVVSGESSVVSGPQMGEDASFFLPSQLPSAIHHPPSAQQVPLMKSEKLFRLLVKTAFQQRRKMLRNGVRGMFDEEFLKNELFNKRAEQLSVEDFAALTFKMK
jgi:16S rRNA (adenine1518-N6/adenine1519-N6)-dimethyltransferase